MLEGKVEILLKIATVSIQINKSLEQ